MFYFEVALGIIWYFIHLKLVETKRKIKVTKEPTELIKKLNLG
jgi:hypothetical protein